MPFIYRRLKPALPCVTEKVLQSKFLLRRPSMSHCTLCGITSEAVHGSPNDSSIKKTISIYPVTANGKPNAFLRGFICGRCLQEAITMRLHVKSQQRKIQVTKHAVERFLERQNGERISEEAAVTSILKMFGHARQIVFRDRFMAQRLLNHGKPANYFFHAGWIFVQSQDGSNAILTVERQWHRKIGRDFWYAEPEAKQPCTWITECSR